jgi:hypothetical protein
MLAGFLYLLMDAPPVNAGPPAAARSMVTFDIAPQALSKALYAYSATTGIEIVVDSRKVAGLATAGVAGVLMPSDALEILLLGTHLVPEPIAPETVALKTDAGGTIPPRFQGIADADLPYFADVQQAIVAALCRDQQAVPGQYRVALKLWIGRSGAVLQAKRLGSTGKLAMDAAIDATMKGVSISAPPPPDLPQPIAIVVDNRSQRGANVCPAKARKAQRAVVHR